MQSGVPTVVFHKKLETNNCLLVEQQSGRTWVVQQFDLKPTPLLDVTLDLPRRQSAANICVAVRVRAYNTRELNALPVAPGGAMRVVEVLANLRAP